MNLPLCHARSRRGRLALLLAAALLPGLSSPADDPHSPKAGDLAEFTLEQLMQLKVTSVSKRPESWFGSAAAIHVITDDDIQRSGATTVADSMRAVPGLHVARLDSHTWAISPRGFNSELASKLLVLMDGRSLYTPLNSGVWWDTVDTMIEDIDRIEIIRGPGGTLWGANAVNGVVNISTKDTRDTQGVLASAGGGTFEKAFGSLRYGGKLNDHAWFRLYGKHSERDDFDLPSGAKAGDSWRHTQGGIRFDYQPTDATLFTVQGDIYSGRQQQTRGDTFDVFPYFAPVAHVDDVSGFNVLGRWTQQLANGGEVKLQTYYDDTRRQSTIPQEDRHTFDLECQHRFPLGRRQEIIWGAGYQMVSDEITGDFSDMLVPAERHTDLVSGFIQDEITLVPDRLRLTLGTKVEHNDYTGFEAQPSVRAAWTPNERQTIWAAVSRAVRTPARAEDDVRLLRGVQPGSPLFIGFLGSRLGGSEELIAYELGYRAVPSPNFSVDLAAFYHDYQHIRTVLAGPPGFNLSPPLTVLATYYSRDILDAQSYGFEAAVGYQVADWWRLRGTYTYTHVSVEDPGPLGLVGLPSWEDTQPANQLSLTTSFDLPGNVQLDGLLRYVDGLNVPGLASHFTLDLRLAWRATKNVELAIVGQNLIDNRHGEFSPLFTTFPATEVPRSIYGKITFKF